MKRKRGKKGKKGKAPPRPAPPSSDANEAAVNLVSLLKEDNSSGDGYDGNEDRNSDDNDEFESRMEVDTPSSTGTDQPLNVASIKPDGSVDKAVGKSVARVKVKLKTSKKIDSQSDTDKSSPQLGSEQKGGANDKIEDSGSSLPILKVYVSGSRKPGSIKIKPSKMVGLTAVKSGDDVVTQEDGSQQEKVSREEGSQLKEVSREEGSQLKEVTQEQSSQQKEDTQEQGSQHKEPSTPQKASRDTKQELDAALLVIKKVMKMDAAEPFNVPVNPEALGIPDYFDIIDTPMDFGTICSNLERGGKYKNSEDVYKDVQYIWDNCFKYNSKGDYILDLMKRVRKNFLKYWTAAELYTEPGSGPNGAGGLGGLKGEVAAVSSQVPAKSGQLKQTTKKRHGRRHKHDCLCAICVLKRRRREREENARLARGQVAVNDKKIDQHLKQNESSLAESPDGGESSSDMGESQDPEDADNELEGKAREVKADVTRGKYSHVDKKQDEEEEEAEEEEESNVDNNEKGKSEKSAESQYAHTTLEEPNRQSMSRIAQSAGSVLPTNRLEGSASVLHEDISAVRQNKQKELQDKEKRAKILEEFQFENPLLRGLCGSLFPENRRSVWSGPHSLVHRKDNDRTSSIHAAIEELMK